MPRRFSKPSRQERRNSRIQQQATDVEHLVGIMYHFLESVGMADGCSIEVSEENVNRIKAELNEHKGKCFALHFAESAARDESISATTASGVRTDSGTFHGVSSIPTGTYIPVSEAGFGGPRLGAFAALIMEAFQQKMRDWKNYNEGYSDGLSAGQLMSIMFWVVASFFSTFGEYQTIVKWTITALYIVMLFKK